MEPWDYEKTVSARTAYDYPGPERDHLLLQIKDLLEEGMGFSQLFNKLEVRRGEEARKIAKSKGKILQPWSALGSSVDLRNFIDRHGDFLGGFVDWSDQPHPKWKFNNKQHNKDIPLSNDDKAPLPHEVTTEHVSSNLHTPAQTSQCTLSDTSSSNTNDNFQVNALSSETSLPSNHTNVLTADKIKSVEKKFFLTLLLLSFVLFLYFVATNMSTQSNGVMTTRGLNDNQKLSPRVTNGPAPNSSHRKNDHVSEPTSRNDDHKGQLGIIEEKIKIIVD
jgi:hypothetical protein